MKPRIAIFSLTGCEGCSLAVLELEDQLLEILDAVEFVNFREAMTERSWDIDIGFVDGAVSTPQDESEVRKFRESCTTLVAMGACACLGGVNTLKNHQTEDDYRTCVYGERADWYPTAPARPISEIVTIDQELPGCPIVKEEFLRFVKFALTGRSFRLPEDPVCVECKKNLNGCLYDKGIVCLGPITRGGCNAICPSYGSKCEACRGLVSDQAFRTAEINLREQYDVDVNDALDAARLFGAYVGPQAADKPSAAVC